MSVDEKDREEVEKSSGGKGPWIAVIAVTILCNASWAAVFLVMDASPGVAYESPSTDSPEAPAKRAESDPGEPGPLMNLDPFVVNLNDAVHARYLRIGVSLELGTDRDRSVVERRTVPLRDQFIRHLSSYEPAQLLSQHDKEALQKTLLEKVHEVVPARSVRHIYFTEFMIQ